MIFSIKPLRNKYCGKIINELIRKKLTKNNYIQNLVKQGEHEHLDFKFAINDAEKFLLNYLQDEKQIKLKQFYKEAKISRYRAINILSNFIALQIIEAVLIDNSICYQSSSSEPIM